jgi:hypothetical protein
MIDRALRPRFAALAGGCVAGQPDDAVLGVGEWSEPVSDGGGGTALTFVA